MKVINLLRCRSFISAPEGYLIPTITASLQLQSTARSTDCNPLARYHAFEPGSRHPLPLDGDLKQRVRKLVRARDTIAGDHASDTGQACLTTTRTAAIRARRLNTGAAECVGSADHADIARLVDGNVDGCDFIGSRDCAGCGSSARRGGYGGVGVLNGLCV